MFKRLRKERGFTIVELVIVIAVIAVIAAAVATAVKSSLYKAKKLNADMAVRRINAELAIEGVKPADEDEASAVANGAGIENLDEIFSGDFTLGYDTSEGVFVLIESDKDRSDSVIVVDDFDTEDDSEEDNGGSGNTEGGGSKDEGGNGGSQDGGSSAGDDPVLVELKAESAKSDDLFVRCDENGDEAADGQYVMFGYYPQSEVDTDTDKYCEYLSSVYCAKSESGGYIKGDGWTEFDYYISYDGAAKLSSVAWYTDADIDGDGRPDYRGVYFTAYRAAFADGSGSTSDGSETERQDKNGYTVNEVYWFKYEPIIWQIILEENGKYTLLCKDIIDCGQYYTTLPEDSAFSESDVYKIFNEKNYQAVFSAAEQNKLSEISLGENDSAKIYIPAYSADVKACVNTFGAGMDLGTDCLKKAPTEYAKCLGASVVGDSGCGYWWLGSRHYDDNNLYDSYVMYVFSDGTVGWCQPYSSAEIGYAPAVTITVTSD